VLAHAVYRGKETCYRFEERIDIEGFGDHLDTQFLQLGSNRRDLTECAGAENDRYPPNARISPDYLDCSQGILIPTLNEVENDQVRTHHRDLVNIMVREGPGRHVIVFASEHLLVEGENVRRIIKGKDMGLVIGAVHDAYSHSN
jgi:hypothetical protein